VTPTSTALVFVSGGIAAIVAIACSGDHSRLAKEEVGSGGGGAGGMGGAASSSASTGSGGTGGIVEPPGPTKLTVVNGIVDHDALRLCFVPYPDGPGGELPWPGVEGLPYARGAAIDVEAVTAEDADVEVVIAAGTLSATGGKSCEELMSAPPAGVEVVSLGVLPAGVFAEEKSILLVPNGCAGGPGHGHEELEETICGIGYAEGLPNASMAAGFMSRIGAADKLPLQFVQASQGAQTLRLQLRPGISGASAQLLLSDWSAGAIAPFPPFQGYATVNLGAIGSVALEVLEVNGVNPLATVSWSAAFANSTMTTRDVGDGDNLTFVAVGPMPGVAAGPWWNGFTFAVVPSDPR
jgi:hypothetical protein